MQQNDMFIMSDMFHTNQGWCIQIYSLFNGDVVDEFYEDRDSDFLHTCKLRLDSLNRI